MLVGITGHLPDLLVMVAVLGGMIWLGLALLRRLHRFLHRHY